MPACRLTTCCRFAIITPYERSLTTTVNDIEHIESQSMYGIGIIKIFFQPTVDIRTATAQVTAISQTAIRQMPAGTLPPIILNYSASTVPVLQLAFSSAQLSEQQLLDLSQNFVRPQLSTIPGAAIPYSYSGKSRARSRWTSIPTQCSRWAWPRLTSRPRWPTRTRSRPPAPSRWEASSMPFHLNDAAPHH